MQWTSFNITTAGTKSEQNVALAVAPSAISNSYDVSEGAVVKNVYFELWITSDDASQSSFVISVEKMNGNLANMSYAQSIALNSYTNKKNVLYTTQGLVGPNTQTPLNVLRFWVKIPKGKQRFGLNDVLKLNLSAITNGLTLCGFSTYKEYN